MRDQPSYSMRMSETPPPRLFKSCRYCRRNKVRCDARIQMPCSRCQRTGRECSLDAIRPSSSRTQRRRPGDGNPSAPIFDAGSSASPRSNTMNGPSNSSGRFEQFSPQDMIAPQSAMHSMSVSLRGTETDDPILIGKDVSAHKGDVIARGIISEEHARSIYERFMNGSKNFLPLFDPIRDTFDSIRSRSLFCFSVIIYLACRAVQGDSYLQRVLQDESQRLAEESFFERPTKTETVQGMLLLAAYSEKTWFSTALILRTALDSGLEKSLDTLLAHTPTPRSYLSASIEDRNLVWQTRTWLISFTLELDVASGTGRKSRLSDLDMSKLRKFLDYPLAVPSDMRPVSIIELHQLRARSRQVIEAISAASLISTELPAIMCRLQNWWDCWDQIHEQNGFHPSAFQRASLKIMLNYAKVFVLCVTIARIQKLQQTHEGSPEIDPEVVPSLWKSLADVITAQLALLVTESAYRCQLTWAPTYPALTVAFIATFAIRVARWHPTLIDRQLVLQRVRQICEYLKEPPYPDIHRTVSIFVNYAGALLAERNPSSNESSVQTRPLDRSSTPRPEFDPDELPDDLADTLNQPNDRDTGLTACSDNGKPVEPRQEPVMPRFLGFDVPNWTLSTSIADFIEEGQTDVFDFLPDLSRT